MPAATSERARAQEVHSTSAVETLLRRVEREYRELPALSVTARQAERLWDMNSATCAVVLQILIKNGLLRRTASGTYVRREER